MGRNTTTNRIYEDPNNFPSGMKALGGARYTQTSAFACLTCVVNRLYSQLECSWLRHHLEVWLVHLSRHLAMQVCSLIRSTDVLLSNLTSSCLVLSWLALSCLGLSFLMCCIQRTRVSISLQAKCPFSA
jgi:hypothetical protein